MFLLSSVLCNSHHPGPRRVWTGSAGSADEFQIAHFVYMFLQQKLLGPHSGALFFIFVSYPSNLEHIFLIVFLEDGLPEMLSKLGVLAERGIKQNNKKTSRDSSDCQKHMVKCQVTKMLTVKTQ